MTKLELIAKALLADVQNPELTDEQKRAVISESVREFTSEMINLVVYLKDEGLDTDTIRGLMETQGILYDGRTNKFK
jgi:hypothetical protein